MRICKDCFETDYRYYWKFYSFNFFQMKHKLKVLLNLNSQIASFWNNNRWHHSPINSTALRLDRRIYCFEKKHNELCACKSERPGRTMFSSQQALSFWSPMARTITIVFKTINSYSISVVSLIFPQTFALSNV